MADFTMEVRNYPTRQDGVSQQYVYFISTQTSIYKVKTPDKAERFHRKALSVLLKNEQDRRNTGTAGIEGLYGYKISHIKTG